jgi:folate-binding protein YgfZ
MNRTVLYDAERDRGARFADYDGWEKPVDFCDCLSEYHAMREGVGLLDRSERGKLLVSGADRLTWLQGMISNDVRPLGDTDKGAKAVCGCVLNATGHLLADVKVINRGDSLLLDLFRPNLDKIHRLLDGFIITEDVQISDVSDSLACLSLQGPAATEAFVREHAHGAQFVAADYTGLGGFDLYLDVSGAVALWTRLVDSGIAPVGEEAVETLRIEAGIPRYGADMDETTIPLECGIESSHISQTKGCYVGQEIIARIVARGHTNRALTGLLLEGSELPHKGDRILPTDGEADREIGWVTSACHSPLLGRGIALGYVRHESRAPGTHVRIDRGDGVVRAFTTDLPFRAPSESESVLRSA